MLFTYCDYDLESKFCFPKDDLSVYVVVFLFLFFLHGFIFKC